MGNDDYEFPWENDENQGGNDASALRKARDEAAKRARDLEKALNDANAKLTERNLKDALQLKGLDPGLAKWLSSDGVDGSDATKVDSWLEENAKLIGYKPAVAEEPGAPDERAADFARMNNVQANALPSGKYTEALSRIANAEDIDSVNEALRSAR